MPHFDAASDLIAWLVPPLDAFERRIVWVTGERHAASTTAADLLTALGAFATPWLSSVEPPRPGRRVAPGDARTLATTEAEAVVVDLFDGIHPDHLAAVHGMVRGCGVLVFVSPPPSVLASQRAVHTAASGRRVDDATPRFAQRLVRLLQTSPVVAHVAAAPFRDGTPRSALGLPIPVTASQANDQRRAVEAMLHAWRGGPGRPVVLIGDRGRGKSAALGIAAAVSDVEHIWVTAPRANSAEQVLRWAIAGERAPDIRFVTPDALRDTYAHTPEAERPGLLLVDEAAALPLRWVVSILDLAPRIALAATVHGYEGSGRGHVHRMLGALRSEKERTRAVHLDSPIRWLPGDPVEGWVYEALLLDAEPVGRDQTVHDLHYTRLDRDQLAQDDELLRNLYGLCMMRETRVTPNHLAELLDRPDVDVFVASHHGEVVGAAWVATEGGLDQETSERAYAGRGDLRGHDIPSVLCRDTAWRNAPTHRGARVVRLAVRPDLQRHRVATALVDHILHTASEHGWTWMGCQFDATPDAVRFWRSASFDPVHLGRLPNAVGAHEITVVRALDDALLPTLAALRDRFVRELPYALSDDLRSLDPDIATLAIRGTSPTMQPRLDAEDRRTLADLAWGARDPDHERRLVLEVTAASLATDRPTLSDQDAALLVMRVLQAHPAEHVAAQLGHESDADVVLHLTRILAHMAEIWGDEDAQDIRARLAAAPARLPDVSQPPIPTATSAEARSAPPG